MHASSVAVIDTTLRQLASQLVADQPDITRVADIEREHIETLKV